MVLVPMSAGTDPKRPGRCGFTVLPLSSCGDPSQFKAGSKQHVAGGGRPCPSCRAASATCGVLYHGATPVRVEHTHMVSTARHEGFPNRVRSSPPCSPTPCSSPTGNRWGQGQAACAHMDHLVKVSHQPALPAELCHTLQEARWQPHSRCCLPQPLAEVSHPAAGKA